MTMGLGSRSRRSWTTLNRDHHQCPNPLYVRRGPVFTEYSSKLVVVIIWGPTCLPEDRRGAVQLVREHLKTAMSRRITTPDAVVRKQTSASKTMCIDKPVLLKEAHISMSEGISHQDFSTPSKITARQRVDDTSWSYHLSYPLCTSFSTWHNSRSFSNFLTSLISTRISITEPSTSRLI